MMHLRVGSGQVFSKTPVQRVIAVSIAIGLVATLRAAGQPAVPYVELIGRAVLPADTFAAGPPSGQFDEQGRRLPQPRFASQPVQGISSIKPGPQPGSWWALPDNGYGTKWNSPDWRLAIYLLAASPQRSMVTVLRRIELRDPDAKFPWRLTEEDVAGRPLTGADLDPESMVVMPDGSFWISDEFGPWLLHFDQAGRLLAAPVDLPDPRPGRAGELLRSPQHPLVLAGQARALVRSSRGLEGLAMASDGRHLLAMLEGALSDDPPDALLLFEFDLAAERYSGRHWRYRTDQGGLSVGEIAVSGDGALLAIERDSRQADAAQLKRIYRYTEPAADAPEDGVLPKTLVADLLSIADPRHLGGPGPLFRYAWLTTESVQAIDERTLLLVNDNNYPATGGQGANVRDLTEWIWLRVGAASRNK